MANTCCPPGYNYNSGSQLCVSASGSGVDLIPVPCTCCPPDSRGNFLSYVDSTGVFYNSYTGTYMTITTYFPNSGPNTVSLTYGKCVLTQTSPIGYGDLYTPIGCPCCPPGYTLNAKTGICQGFLATDVVTASDAYCLPCICPVTPPPPPCIGCQANNGVPITFQWNDHKKQCAYCVPDESTPITDKKLNCFAPYFINVPIINFTLD